MIGTGSGVAAIFNARAKSVSPKVVRALTRALPKALVLVSEDFEQARRHARRLAQERPDFLLIGGGDGTIVKILNLLREAGGPMPPLGLLKLGTGNGWAGAVGAKDFYETLRGLPAMSNTPPTRRFDLMEVEGSLCHFAGVGWDARIIDDYLRNLDKRSSQLIGSRISTRLHKGLGGYLYALFRITVPEEVAVLWREGQPHVTLEALSGQALTLDSQGRPLPITTAPIKSPLQLYEGPIGVGGGATEPEWGYGFRAFPFSQAVPGYLNMRVYGAKVLDAVRSMRRLWRGEFPMPHMHDFFVERARMRFSRAMPFQIGGDGAGWREEIEMKIADEKVDIIDWTAALAGPPAPPPVAPPFPE